MPQKTLIHFNLAGQEIGREQIDVAPEDANAESTMQNAQAQAQAAITNLRAYLALPSPTAAQTTAVVKLLCRAMLQVIRIILQRWDDSD